MNDISPLRKAKIERAASLRQPDLTIILENVHDPHNIGAVLRSCDSVGLKEVFVLYTESHLNEDHLKLGKRTSSGARKWLDVHLYDDVDACFEHVKKNYSRVLTTHLAEDAVSLYELDLTQSVALLFGNERDGVSEAALKYSDGNFLIPQVGMVESLNISVACAVTLYEAFRQRQAKRFYGGHPDWTPEKEQALLENYMQRHYRKIANGKTKIKK